jgi:predicted deacylase
MKLDLTLPEVENGEIYRGYIPVTSLPTGTSEDIPLIIAEGIDDGETLFLTGSIHGNEATGMAVCQDVIFDELVTQLSGTIISLPNLNPAGLRITTRESYYDDEDPNRQFPDVEYVNSDEGPTEFRSGPRPPTQQQIICRRIFELFEDYADVLLDMHTASAGAFPFVIKDRVLYDRGLGRTEQEASALADEIEELADVFSLPVMFEYEPEEYIDEGFQSSTAGAALNQAGIPALTVELGTCGVVDDELRTQGVAGVYRVMRQRGMVEFEETAFPDDLGPIPSPVVDPVDYQVRRHVGPYASIPGIVRHEVSGGDTVEEGDTIARIVPPNADPEGICRITADASGWVIQRYNGLVRYENQPVAMMAVKDDGDRVATPPEDE